MGANLISPHPVEQVKNVCKVGLDTDYYRANLSDLHSASKRPQLPSTPAVLIAICVLTELAMKHCS